MNLLARLGNGLNIEGCRPVRYLPNGCTWWNIIQVIDNPYRNITFDNVLDITKKCGYDYLEQAVGINVEELINTYSDLIEKGKSIYTNVLVHIHQYEGTTQLHERLAQRCGVTVITDVTNFYEHPTDYKRLYPDTDLLISISQCAGIGEIEPGMFIIPDQYIEYDLSTNKITEVFGSECNHILTDNAWGNSFFRGNMIVVDHLWNPEIE